MLKSKFTTLKTLNMRDNLIGYESSEQIKDALKTINGVFPGTYFICLLNQTFDVHTSVVEENSDLEPEEILQLIASIKRHADHFGKSDRAMHYVHFS